MTASWRIPLCSLHSLVSQVIFSLLAACSAEGDYEPGCQEEPSAAPGRPVSIAAGSAHSCMVLEGGSLRCWGRNNHGQLGVVSKDDRLLKPTPVAVAAVRAVTLGGSYDGGHTCAVLRSGRALCWGQNNYGQLGTGDNEDRTQPHCLNQFPQVLQVATGMWHSCALVSPQAVRCWGFGGAGQLGDGESGIERPPQLSPVEVNNLPGEGVSALALGAQHSLALSAAGYLRGFGLNLTGQLGTTVQGDTRSVPTDVVFPTGAGLPVLQAAAGYQHSCAVMSDQSLYCFGDNRFGQLGVAVGDRAYAPQRVLGPGQVLAVALGGDHGCALRSGDRAVLCWGRNEWAQAGGLKFGDRADIIATPTQVPGLAGVQQLALGSHHSCALLSDGEVRCWGRGEFGQLGDGTLTLSQPVPQVVVIP